MGSPAQPKLLTKATKKRRREDEDDALPAKQAAPTAPATAADDGGSKKKKRKRTKQIVEDPKDADKKDGIDESIGKMDGPLLADFFAQQAKRHNSELTAVELADVYVPEQAFLDTTSWKSPRKLENLPTFLKVYSRKKGSPDSLSTAPEENGSPHTIVITLAGLRAADITRALRQFQSKDCAVAKLFAKHIKLAEAKEFMKKTRVGIGIGTPVRLNDLAASGELSLTHLKRIVIDGSYVDQKKRGIFDMKDLHLPLLQFLNRADLRDRYSSSDNRVEILVF
ncbi:protein CMS1 [Blastomyces parvus]|uniref:Protein CMS1 n=1 Tax=Blastomyces parvus TaxID=2060905 RepID=A0A2B7XLP3_9EURO|nr:protein CMS1 [Blastomyces parvus]